MCIRDRYQSGLGDTLQALTAFENVAVLIYVALLITMLVLCLLYTSDAADERSSVDLGGRRIIKNKKQSTPQVHADTQHIIEIKHSSNIQTQQNIRSK